MSELELVTGPEPEVFAPRRARRRVPVLVAMSALILVSLVLLAFIGERVAPYGPGEQDLLLGATGPSSEHWFGTDDLGRDLLSRVLSGARTALLGPLAIAVGAMGLGTLLGLLAGYRGGVVDTLLMRWVDLMFAFPAILIAIVVVGVLGGGYWVAVLVLVILTAPYDTRIIRGAVLEQKPLPYVEAARALGVASSRIMIRHIYPNITPLIVANTFLTFAVSLVSLSALAFLGIGIEPGSTDWGKMVAENQPLLLVNAMAVLGPGAAVVLTATAANILGDYLYETLSERGRAR